MTRSMAAARGGAPLGNGGGLCAEAAAASASRTRNSERTNICLELRKVSGGRTGGGLHARIVDGQVSGHAALENVDRIGTETRQPVQLELHDHGTARLLRRRRQSLPDDAKCPAAAIVLEAEHSLQGLAVDQRIVPASNHRPVADRPLAGQIDLLQLRNVAAGVDLLPNVA